MKQHQRVVAVFVLLSFFAVLLGLLQPMHHSFGCPFTFMQEVGCVLPTDHVTHWEDMVLGLASMLWFFVPLLTCCGLSVVNQYSLSLASVRMRTRPREKNITRLFSQGILHPKIPEPYAS